MTSSYVLITGASSGIGKALALEFAKEGHPLILVARREEKLQELATEVQETYKVAAEVITADLGVNEGPQKLWEALQTKGLHVETLVNNAGIGQSGPFAKSDPGVMLTLLQLNITSLTHLTRLLLPAMLEKNQGRIINVGSTAGFQPGPNMAIYYASKAYVYSFTEALVEELRDTNVSAMNLAPGATYTEFQDKAEIADSVLFAAGVMSAQDVAKAGVKGAKSGRSLVIPGLKNKIGALGVPFVPRGLMRKMVAKVNSKRS